MWRWSGAPCAAPPAAGSPAPAASRQGTSSTSTGGTRKGEVLLGLKSSRFLPPPCRYQTLAVILGVITDRRFFVFVTQTNLSC